MPSTLSVGWFGCKRFEKVPGRPIVVLAVFSILIFFAPTIRSMLDINLQTAAIISEVSPREIRLISKSVVSEDKINSRNSATVQCLILSKIRILTW